MRPSWVEVDLAAIRHNVAAIVNEVAPSEVCTVVKADGYGHGDVPVAEAAVEAGAAWLAVATVGEGIRLREAGVWAPILLLSEPLPSDAEQVVRHHLTPTVYSTEMVEILGEASPEPLSVHIKVDPGMLEVGGVWTHFPSAEMDAEFTKQQIELLGTVVDGVRSDGIDPGIVHAANSAGALLYPEGRFDMVRTGLSTYGYYPSVECREVVDLMPAMRVVSHVSYIKRLPAGARPAYGRIRPLAAESTVATVPIGYADGVTRRLQGHYA